FLRSEDWRMVRGQKLKKTPNSANGNVFGEHFSLHRNPQWREFQFPPLTRIITLQIHEAEVFEPMDRYLEVLKSFLFPSRHRCLQDTRQPRHSLLNLFDRTVSEVETHPIPLATLAGRAKNRARHERDSLGFNCHSE